MDIFQLGYMFASTVAGFGAFCALMAYAAWIEGRLAAKSVRLEADRLLAEPVTSDVVGAFRCDHCERLVMRGQSGQVCLGIFEFCSRDCASEPVMFTPVRRHDVMTN